MSTPRILSIEGGEANSQAGTNENEPSPNTSEVQVISEVSGNPYKDAVKEISVKLGALTDNLRDALISVSETRGESQGKITQILRELEKLKSASEKRDTDIKTIIASLSGDRTRPPPPNPSEDTGPSAPDRETGSPSAIDPQQENTGTGAQTGSPSERDPQQDNASGEDDTEYYLDAVSTTNAEDTDRIGIQTLDALDAGVIL